MIIMLGKFWGKNVRIIDDEGVEWKGFVRSVETPADSEDNQWWLDVINVNKPGFETGLIISESEIKKIEVV